jgi:hypothetical protein
MMLSLRKYELTPFYFLEICETDINSFSGQENLRGGRRDQEIQAEAVGIY